MEHKLGPIGLEKRPTYNELVSYIERDPDKIKYPPRSASRAWDSIFRVDFSSQAPMAALIDEHAQANDPGTTPYLPPSDRPPAPGPPPADVPGGQRPPWWRYMPTPIPVDPRYYINRVSGNGGPDSHVYLDDMAEPLLENDYLGPPPGPGGGGIPHPAHQAAAAQQAAAETQMNAIAEAASQSQVISEVVPNEAPPNPEDALMAQWNGTTPPSGEHPFSDAISQMQHGQAAATLAGIAAMAGGAGALAGSLGKTALASAPGLASSVAGAAAAAGSAVLNVAGSTFHAADSAMNSLAANAALGVDNVGHMSQNQVLGTALGTTAALASLAPQAAIDSFVLGATLPAAAAAHYLARQVNQHGFRNAMQQAMPSLQNHATHAMQHMASLAAPPVPALPVYGHEIPNTAHDSEGATRVALWHPSSSSSSSSSSSLPVAHNISYWQHASEEEIEAELTRMNVPRREWVGRGRAYKLDVLLDNIQYDANGSYRYRPRHR
jgi:hypothetical protein